ncbi:hypothetical protein KCP78_03830 [Salmonella enterica subsp. enterica]|nr:hypothetical protein KCP78_03830 [Salmonella enterica subsp. enterica]
MANDNEAETGGMAGIISSPKSAGKHRIGGVAAQISDEFHITLSSQSAFNTYHGVFINNGWHSSAGLSTLCNNISSAIPFPDFDL